MNPKTCVLRLARLFAVVACCLSLETQGQIVISEIMYHPVEEPAFNTDGSPVLDLYEDVHEFVEIHNPGPNTVDLTAWKITGGIRYPPTENGRPPGGYLVIAKNPARLAAVPAWSGACGTADPHKPAWQR